MEEIKLKEALMGRRNEGVSFINDHKVYQGDTKWWDRLKPPYRPKHWLPHPYEKGKGKGKRCQECGENMKAIKSWSANPQNDTCLEKWICRCNRHDEVWRYHWGLWKNL